MSEQKEPLKPLAKTAKEFIPKSKEKKSVDKQEAPLATGTTAGTPAKLNPSATAFKPRSASTEVYGDIQPVMVFVPAFYQEIPIEPMVQEEEKVSGKNTHLDLD